MGVLLAGGGVSAGEEREFFQRDVDIDMVHEDVGWHTQARVRKIEQTLHTASIRRLATAWAAAPGTAMMATSISKSLTTWPSR